MTDYCNEIIEKLNEDIIELTRENGNSLILYEKAINLVLEQITTTKDFILNKGFKNLEEEIHFFKELKPKILSKLIYYWKKRSNWPPNSSANWPPVSVEIDHPIPEQTDHLIPVEIDHLKNDYFFHVVSSLNSFKKRRIFGKQINRHE